jgi:hypothetical protein
MWFRQQENESRSQEQQLETYCRILLRRSTDHALHLQAKLHFPIRHGMVASASSSSSLPPVAQVEDRTVGKQTYRLAVMAIEFFWLHIPWWTHRLFEK